MANVLLEALVVGVVLVVLGMILHLISMKFMKHDMNDNLTLAVHFFVIGFIFHLLCEVTNVNKWYCKHGQACSK
jgi:hypothetical protein